MELKCSQDPDDKRYQTFVNMVKGFADCIIENDLDVFIGCWLHFRLETSATPIGRLKELLQLLFRNEMELKIDHGNMILFKDAPLNTYIPVCELSPDSKKYLTAMVQHPFLFFDSVDGMAIQYMTFDKFKFNATFRDSDLWVQMITHFMELMLEDRVNQKYLNGRANEILTCFITEEVAHSQEDFNLKGGSDGRQWRTKNSKYISNLLLLYNKFSKRLQPF